MRDIAKKALLAVLLAASLRAATVIVVRHAERIYVTDVRRTQQTAEPVAAALHLKPVVIAKSDLNALISQIKKAGENETVLVVGHTDTVPAIIERLGGGKVPPLRDTEYDRLTIVFTGANGEAHVVTLRYGKGSP